ncbi:MAG: hypothetical protein A3D44_00475 [Candidatus Staskawiczbacteria bacterium RIFCSPHIGHO2_02_FULL_42_22]|uniref:DUF218 domain-containing protein n=1 Tax=Candidatus Staskawiczbacteria bacterium RIFCSPHIGHO2_02_FULL_42_22 TaxID=1802207 RepID=A0A1G2I4E6_9BACT|nr:MAG: hypothetical protein A3D44_00475 [Candidatus Staskawiczbacteria bacterium RIFCSPHIGHO2_02_FULL_42_22]
MKKQYDLVIQLGSQVMCKEELIDMDGTRITTYFLAPHTRMRTDASAIVIRKGIAPRLMISGGSNFGVRYDDKKIFNAEHPTQNKAAFTFEAFADADYHRKSEAAVIKDMLVKELGVPSTKVFAETLSATTEENAEFVKIMLKRRPMFTGNEKLAILTLLYHMSDSIVKAPEGDKRKPGALAVFRSAGLNVDPLFAENVLADSGSREIERVCEYYKTPKGGKQYDVDRMRDLLTEGKSLTEMMD